jgi:adenylate cyclase
LFVVGRNSVFAYKGKSGNLVQIARELGVKFLLEGSVRKSGQKIRITAQFIDGATGGHLWADRYDRDLTDIFALQDEITGTIVEQLQLNLGVAETHTTSKTRTQNVDAYSCYLKGRQLYHMRTPRLLERGRQMFKKAVELDPGFARAYAGIADCDSFANSWFGADVSIDEILETTSKAIELEPNLAEAHAAKGLALQTAGREAEAANSFEHALSIDPFCYESHYYFARYCLVRKNFERCAAHFIRALEIRPDDYRSPLLLDAVLKQLGREQERQEYIQLGLKRAESAVALHPENSDPLELGATVLAAGSDQVLAREWLDRALLVRGESNAPTYNIACAYLGLGDTETAIDILEKVVENVGLGAIHWISADLDMDPIRDHPRFQRLMRT